MIFMKKNSALRGLKGQIKRLKTAINLISIPRFKNDILSLWFNCSIFLCLQSDNILDLLNTGPPVALQPVESKSSGGDLLDLLGDISPTPAGQNCNYFSNFCFNLGSYN